MDTFQALSDPVRRSLVETLATGERTAGALADHAQARFGISQPATSKHLKVLRDAGLVSTTVDAQRRIYRLDPEPLDELAAWARRQARFWTERLDNLEAHLDGPQPPEEQP